MNIANLDQSWRKLPELRARDPLLFVDTSGYPLPGKIVPCLMCGDPFIMRKFIGEPDQICPECAKVYDEAAIVVCFNCKVAICRLKPGVLDNGFTIHRRAVLHCDACNICQYGLTESHLIEVEQWERQVRPHKPTIIVPGKYQDVREAARLAR